MIKIDQELLDSIGLGALPPDVAHHLLEHIHDTLQVRVGTEIALAIGDERVEQFAEINDEASKLAFLEEHIPHHSDISRAHFEALTEEVRTLAPQILELEGLGPGETPSSATDVP